MEDETMKMSEMIEAMEKAGVDGSSALHLRSEELQHKKRVARIPMLKNALKKKKLLLLVAEIALPFNPETGEADEKYNVSNKYRPPFSAASVALALKDLANQNEKLKATLMKRAGLTEWDTSDCVTFTKADWDVFGKYRVPRIFSISAVHIDIPAMGTGKYGRDFAITVKRDDDLNVIGEMPLCLKVNKFFRDRAYEEVSAYRKSVESGECADTEKQQSEYISKIYGRVPVTDDQPKNFVFLYELPIDNVGVLMPEVLGDLKPEDLKQYEVVSRYKKGIRLAMESYLDGNWSRYDNNFDFFEVEMTCPTKGDESTQAGKAEIGRDTRFERPTIGMKSHEDYALPDGGYRTDNLCRCIQEALDADTDIEVRMRRSMGISMLDENVENQMISSVRSVIDVENDKYITDKVIESNQDVIRLAFGDEGDEIIEESVAGVSGREGGALDSSAAVTEAKEYDLAKLSGTDDEMEFASLDLAVDE